MFAFKILFTIAALLGSSMDADGWVTLDRPKKEIPSSEDIDPSIWVVFSKQLANEKILLRFPEDPTYRYLSQARDEMEIIGASESAEHRLQILPPQAVSSPQDRMYTHDGIWFFERVITTPHHTYFFQTKATSMDAVSHEKFVSSFDLETIRF